VLQHWRVSGVRGKLPQQFAQTLWVLVRLAPIGVMSRKTRPYKGIVFVAKTPRLSGAVFTPPTSDRGDRLTEDGCISQLGPYVLSSPFRSSTRVWSRCRYSAGIHGYGLIKTCPLRSSYSFCLSVAFSLVSLSLSQSIAVPRLLTRKPSMWYLRKAIWHTALESV
jgi:hypothetical protein